jgi:DNA-binding NarL/FixJ family response regulator
MRILIADDHCVVRRGLRALLESRPGWEVCAEASNGLAAVALAQQLRPHVAVLDLAMPLLNGLGATRRIRGVVPMTATVLFTVHASEELAARALEAGAAGYVVKSEPADDLLSAIESASRNECVVSRASKRAGSTLPGKGAGRTLTPREREILQLIAEEKSNKEIARLLGIAAKTVEAHRAHLSCKLHLRSIVPLVRYAVRNHLVDP